MTRRVQPEGIRGEGRGDHAAVQFHSPDGVRPFAQSVRSGVGLRKAVNGDRLGQRREQGKELDSLQAGAMDTECDSVVGSGQKGIRIKDRLPERAGAAVIGIGNGEGVCAHAQQRNGQTDEQEEFFHGTNLSCRSRAHHSQELSIRRWSTLSVAYVSSSCPHGIVQRKRARVPSRFCHMLCLDSAQCYSRLCRINCSV